MQNEKKDCVSAKLPKQGPRDRLALLSGSTNEDRFCVSGRSARQRQGRTSPDDIDRCDRSPQCLFDSASENLELIVAREDKSWYDEHSLSYQRSIGEMDDDEGEEGNKQGKLTSRGIQVRAQVCGLDSGVGFFPNAKRVKKGFHGARPVPVPCQARQSTRVAPRGVTATGVCAGACLGHLCCVIVIVIGQTRTKCGESVKVVDRARSDR